MEPANGVLQLSKGGGMLRQARYSFSPRPNDVFIPDALIRKYRLVAGATVEGPASRGRDNRMTITDVTSVCGLAPADFAERKPFDELTSIDPLDRFHLGRSSEMTMRVMDLVAPVGKGTRGLVVSPPKAGKTTILRDFVKAVRAEDPDLRVVALLIDERPEEVTEFRRQTQAEVLASSMDQMAAEHTALASLVHDHVRCELECGRNVVVVIDSLTRMARAYNVHGPRDREGRQMQRGGGTMSGGLGAGAMEVPRRIFGLARNIEHGGSVTVIASILVDTGSRMDQVIFEEFKGTGNSELVLDQKLSESRIFPAIDIAKSGTRREEKLLTEPELKAIHAIRRTLANANTQEATKILVSRLGKFASNEEFIRQVTPE
ncbi:MAG: transcription termination factor Rho [Phycisphaerae bacterium]|nr:transcription termination factor Rho [Phycisphaerae bacterium]